MPLTMAVSSPWNRRFKGSFIKPTILSFITSTLIVFYIFATSRLVIVHPHQTRIHNLVSSPSSAKLIAFVDHHYNKTKEDDETVTHLLLANTSLLEPFPTAEKLVQNKDVFHDEDLFEEEYKEMNRTLKIYVYPHKKNDPFANVLLPVDHEPSGNYASESYFKKALYKSHFITNDPKEAHLFYLPFSIASLRNDKRVGVGGIQDFVKNYIVEVGNGESHSCEAKCYSSGLLFKLLPIWKKLAFFAGAMNSRVRKNLVQTWKNDSEIMVHRGRMKTPYSEALLGSKYCIHAKGFEINTARIGDALYYGCVPVILADHYDLPYTNILNWQSFSVVVSSLDIPKLKQILEEIEYDQYVKLQNNVMQYNGAKTLKILTETNFLPRVVRCSGTLFAVTDPLSRPETHHSRSDNFLLYLYGGPPTIMWSRCSENLTAADIPANL
ncbi:hypothetical protein HAX54_040394 [Datura stramonium]|uniref:Exostosin GT47 domain-containing protein n=1 Tax=Datura stramonium TaxID=4076 RepID=A0ABS8RNB0_DATST|nr:hypothetical protein [Datura stramonium]